MHVLADLSDAIREHLTALLDEGHEAAKPIEDTITRFSPEARPVGPADTCFTAAACLPPGWPFLRDDETC